MRYIKRIGKAVRGFTLVEMTVVIAIIAVLASLALPAVTGVSTDTRDSSKSGDLSLVEQAVTRYQSDNGTLPITQSTSPATFVKDVNSDGDIIIRVDSSAANATGTYPTADVTCTSSSPVADALATCLGTIDFANKLIPAYLKSLPKHGVGTVSHVTATATSGTGIGDNDATTADYTITDCNRTGNTCKFYLDNGDSLLGGNLKVWNVTADSTSADAVIGVLVLREDLHYGK